MKRGFSLDLGRIRNVIEKNFPVEIKEENGKFSLSYGAIKHMIVGIENKKLIVDTESNAEVKDDQILDTNKRFRIFLEEATGYTSKERLKKAKKEVQGD